MLGFRNDFCFADIPGKNQKSVDLMRIHKLWQFCGCKSYITGYLKVQKERFVGYRKIFSRVTNAGMEADSIVFELMNSNCI